MPSTCASLAAHGIEPIDLVAVNLYDFAKVAAKKDAPLEELIENIDIGGPTMIRAAAKNWQDVGGGDFAGGLCRDTSAEMQEHKGTAQPRDALAAGEAGVRADGGVRPRGVGSAGGNRAAPDAAHRKRCPRVLDLRAPRKLALRYGENPHQSAALYASGATGIAGARTASRQGAFLQQPGGPGRRLAIDRASSTNLPPRSSSTPILAAARRRPTLAESYSRAFEADPVSAYGGVLAFNSEVDAETAGEIAKTFIEAIAAPGYSR